jgi:uncharacterized membrane protein YccC
MDLSLAGITTDAVVIASVALLIRSLAALVPRLGDALVKLIDAFGRAMEKRAEAMRLAAEAKAIEATATTEDLARESKARAALEERVEQLVEQMAEKERGLTHEIDQAHQAHAVTLGALEQLRADADSERHRCDRALAAIRNEMEERINQITSGHTPLRR